VWSLPLFLDDQTSILILDECYTLGSCFKSRDSSVGIVIPGMSNIFLFLLGPTQPPIHWVPGTLSPGLKRQGREADHSSPSSAEVKNDSAIP
jgi:hypothetical protein